MSNPWSTAEYFPTSRAGFSHILDLSLQLGIPLPELHSTGSIETDQSTIIMRLTQQLRMAKQEEQAIHEELLDRQMYLLIYDILSPENIDILRSDLDILTTYLRTVLSRETQILLMLEQQHILLQKSTAQSQVSNSTNPISTDERFIFIEPQHHLAFVRLFQSMASILAQAPIISQRLRWATGLQSLLDELHSPMQTVSATLVLYQRCAAVLVEARDSMQNWLKSSQRHMS